MNEPLEVLPVNRYLRLWILFKRVYDILVKIRNRELRQYDSNLEQIETFQAVQRLGMNATPNEIATLRYRRPHTISVLLKNMENAGLITRNKDLSRKNMIRIALTEKGKKASLKFGKSDSIKKILSTLSKKEKGQLFFIGPAV